ncbi:MAG: hypothetical protein IJY61_05840 [Candidatus Gastranaerophilales bacterium]|nr:hypothetical protein [Candidatus Gastranaerophilales bacterium]
MKTIMLMLQKDSSQNDKTKLFKMIIIVIVSILLLAFIYNKILLSFISYNASDIDKENYSYAVSDLTDALNLEFAVYGNETYSTAEDLALSLNYRLPIKSLYYIRTKDNEPIAFNSYEIFQYRLKEFQNRPTLIGYDGTLMSIIKFKEGCKYVNSKLIGKSDCIIEVDVNHFLPPNQIGKDRVLFAIDGITNSIKTDNNYFN